MGTYEWWHRSGLSFVFPSCGIVFSVMGMCLWFCVSLQSFCIVRRLRHTHAHSARYTEINIQSMSTQAKDKPAEKKYAASRMLKVRQLRTYGVAALRSLFGAMERVYTFE